MRKTILVSLLESWRSCSNQLGVWFGVPAWGFMGHCDLLSWMAPCLLYQVAFQGTVLFAVPVSLHCLAQGKQMLLHSFAA